MSDPVRRRVAASFAGWGIPTTEALVRARTAAPSAFLIASGGVRSGIDVAKALALGADAVGIAGPLLRAAADGEQALAESVSIILEELRIAMFCTGAATVSELWSAARLRRKEGQFL
jgi:isopentenyl-diphosphate delta-isomerase